MPENGSTLAVFYENWLNYQNLIIKAIAPLTPEQLTQRADPRLRSIDIILRHVIGARARWFHQMMGIGDEEFISMGGWDRQDAPERSAAELVHGLEKTWSVMYEAISSWTEEDCILPIRTILATSQRPSPASGSSGTSSSTISIMAARSP